MGVHRLDDERPAALGRQPSHTPRDVALGPFVLLTVLRVAAEVAGQQRGVDLARLEQEPGDSLEAGEILLAAAREVDRVSRLGGRAELDRELAGQSVAELGQIEAGRVARDRRR